MTLASHGGSASVSPVCPASWVATLLSHRESDGDGGFGRGLRTEEILMRLLPQQQWHLTQKTMKAPLSSRASW